VLLAAVVGLATVLNLLLIGDKSIWLDEGHSISFVTSGWGDLWTIVRERQANMSLYYVLLKLWIPIFEGEAWLRGLSALAAVGTVPLVYLVTLRLWDRRHALLAAFLITVNAFFVRYGQEARGYSLALFLVTLSTYLFIRTLEKPTARGWLGYVLISSLAAYAHFYAGLVIAGHVMSLGFRSLPESKARLAVVFGAIGALTAPLIAFVLFNESGQIDWISDPSLQDLLGALRDLSGEGGDLLLALYALLAVLGVAALRRSHPPADEGPQIEGWKIALLLGWLLIPVVSSFVVSYVTPIFLDRYLIVSLPALAILAARGLLAIPWRMAAAAVVVLMVGLSSVGLYRYYTGDKEEWRAAVRHVLEDVETGDGIVIFAGRVRKPFEYYVDLFDAESLAPEPIYPSAEWGEFGSGGLEAAKPALFEGLGETYPRVWLVLSHHQAGASVTKSTAAIQSSLAADYEVAGTKGFKKIQVVLYEARSGDL
jgi:mannosyltransferase